MTKLKTHYQTLKIVEDAPEEVIKGAYKYLAQKWHPDKHPSRRDEADQTLKEINEAYAVLLDPVKRRQHDRWIAEEHAKKDRAAQEQVREAARAEERAKDAHRASEARRAEERNRKARDDGWMTMEELEALRAAKKQEPQERQQRQRPPPEPPRQPQQRWQPPPQSRPEPAPQYEFRRDREPFPPPRPTERPYVPPTARTGWDADKLWRSVKGILLASLGLVVASIVLAGYLGSRRPAVPAPQDASASDPAAPAISSRNAPEPTSPNTSSEEASRDDAPAAAPASTSEAPVCAVTSSHAEYTSAQRLSVEADVNNQGGAGAVTVEMDLLSDGAVVERANQPVSVEAGQTSAVSHQFNTMAYRGDITYTVACAPE
jgi:curved DNA-binding protein CbpA